MPVEAGGSRQVLKVRRVQHPAPQRCRQRLRTGKQRKKLGIRKEGGDALGDPFASAARHKPMMQNSYAHGLT